MIDFTRKGPRSDTTESLMSLKADGKDHVVIFHDKTTSFSAWLASRRRRLKRQFKYSRTTPAGEPLPEGFYRVFVSL